MERLEQIISEAFSSEKMRERLKAEANATGKPETLVHWEDKVLSKWEEESGLSLYRAYPAILERAKRLVRHTAPEAFSTFTWDGGDTDMDAVFEFITARMEERRHNQQQRQELSLERQEQPGNPEAGEGESETEFPRLLHAWDPNTDDRVFLMGDNIIATEGTDEYGLLEKFVSSANRSIQLQGNWGHHKQICDRINKKSRRLITARKPKMILNALIGQHKET